MTRRSMVTVTYGQSYTLDPAVNCLGFTGLQDRIVREGTFSGLKFESGDPVLTANPNLTA